MKKFLVAIKLVLAYWISALIADAVLWFDILGFVPIIEREIIIKIIFAVLYVVLATIAVAYDGVRKNKIGIAMLSVQFIVSSLMIAFGQAEIIYVISTPVAMGNYILYGNYSEYEPMKSLLYFVLSLSLTFLPFIIGSIINSAMNKKGKTAVKSKMSKKKFYIIFTCCIVVALIIFQVAMYYFVGEDVLLKNGAMRTIWLLFPIVFISLSFVRDLIIKRKYEDNDKKEKDNIVDKN